MTFLEKSKFVAAAALFVLAACGPGLQAKAQSSDSGLMPATTVSVDGQLSSAEETHPPLRLTPDRSEILNMDENVERVIIGNEEHLNILMDTQKRLILVPRIPGATFFTLLGANGKVLMQRHAIIAAPEQKYLRIRQPCVKGNCQPVRMYYCPDMCHEVGIIGKGGTTLSGTIGQESDMSSSNQAPFPTTSSSNNSNSNNTSSNASNSNSASEGE